MVNARVARRPANEPFERLLHAIEVELFGIRTGQHDVGSYIVRLCTDRFRKKSKCVRPLACAPRMLGDL
jgi:hypothetical protein